MLRYSRSLLIVALLFLLAGCGAEATVGTNRTLGDEPTATATTAAATATPSPPAPTATTAAPPTATTAPTATVAATASPTTVAPNSPTRPVPTATTVATPPPSPTAPATTGGALVADSDNRCQMILPAGMTEDAPGSGEFTIENDGGLALLQSIQGADMGTTVSLFVQSFSPVFSNYQETDRKKTADSEQVDFTGELIQPVRGTMYFKQIDNVICNIILVVYTSSSYPYDEALATMIGSVQLVKP